MNAFGYVGQQTINTDGTVTDNPSATTGTWTGSGGAQNQVGGGSSSNVHFYQSGMIGWYASAGNP